MPSTVIESLVLLPLTLALAVGLGVPTLWLVIPFLVVFITGRAPERYGLTWANTGSVKFHLITASVIWGGYAIGHSLFARVILGRHFQFQMPPEFAEMVLVQIGVVGLSEEFFFRGYLQTHLDEWLGRPWRVCGAQVGWGLIIAAVLFGLCHLVRGDVTQLRVIFFGLFAGWLRCRTDTIAVPAVYHGLSNCLYYVLLASFPASGLG